MICYTPFFFQTLTWEEKFSLVTVGRYIGLEARASSVLEVTYIPDCEYGDMYNRLGLFVSFVQRLVYGR